MRAGNHESIALTDVRFVADYGLTSNIAGGPKSAKIETHALHQIVSLFDHVVGSGEEGRWEIQPDGLRGVEI
jgi:hypothetical protein